MIDFFRCPKVPCPGYYSSINYLLLGLIMQHVWQVAAWEDWDQLSVIFPRHRSVDNFLFALKGKNLGYHHYN